MPRILIDNKIVISYDSSARDKYWTALSKYLIEKHGKRDFTEPNKVESILLDAFNFLIDNFRKLIMQEDSLTFFIYVFWLHEESIKIYFKTLSGLKIDKIDESEFARYRRILKLILEQGCDINLAWGKLSSGSEVLSMDIKIQELLYLGTWIYGFADNIAYQKMIEDCYEIKFDKENLLSVNWQYHYGETYNQLFPTLVEDYEKGTFDEQATRELVNSIENCFGINYKFASGIIFEIKKLHSPKDPTFQTIEPQVLPLNLEAEFKIDKVIANKFYDGLTISRKNKLTIEEAVLKPYSTKRYAFRPILVYRIGGEDRALVGIEKFTESMMVLATNAIHWNAMLSEWLELKCMQNFITNKGNDHDAILEDEIEEIVRKKRFRYCRNIKSFKQASKTNVRIDNEVAGEIDLIVVNPRLKTVFVADSKYNRARYEGVGYRNDYTNFIKSYEPQLSKKINWVSNNLKILQEHLQIIYNSQLIDLTNFKVEGIFIINTPTFYMFNGKYKAITLRQIGDFLEGKYQYPDLYIYKEAGDDEMLMIVKHPYFKKPVFFRQ
jgi:hypothetical protein